MERDASILGIHPPHTVRIDLDGWVQDWPWETVKILGDRITITASTLPKITGTGAWSHYDGKGHITLFYPFEHRHERTDGSWLFVGGITHRDFIVSQGPPQAPSMDTYGPARAHAA